MQNPVIDQNGVLHASQTECAKAHGVTVSAITYHLATYGDLNRLCGKQGREYATEATMKPVTVGKRTWPSRAALARDLGEARVTVGRWLHPDASTRQRARLQHRLAMLDAIQ